MKSRTREASRTSSLPVAVFTPQNLQRVSSSSASTSSLMSKHAMPDHTTQHLFAILHGKEEIRRIPLQQNLQEVIGGLFASQAEVFRSEDEEVLAFDPSLRPAEDQIIRIGGFDL